METCDDFCFPLRTGAIRARLRKPFLCSAIQFVGCDDDSHACCSDAPVPHEQNKAKNRAEISYEKKATPNSHSWSQSQKRFESRIVAFWLKFLKKVTSSIWFKVKLQKNFVTSSKTSVVFGKKHLLFMTLSAIFHILFSRSITKWKHFMLNADYCVSAMGHQGINEGLVVDLLCF